jgi:hypothetical protein
MAAHELFIKRASSQTVVSIRHTLIGFRQRSNTEIAMRRKSNDMATDRTSITSGICYKKEPTIVALRYGYYIIKGKKKKYHRVFVNCSDSGMYARLGWVLNDDVDHCMICQEAFSDSMISGKHHCRACGDVICNSCSQGRAVVQPVETLGAVRVCGQCFYGQVCSLNRPIVYCSIFNIFRTWFMPILMIRVARRSRWRGSRNWTCWMMRCV